MTLKWKKVLSWKKKDLKKPEKILKKANITEET